MLENKAQFLHRINQFSHHNLQIVIAKRPSKINIAISGGGMYQIQVSVVLTNLFMCEPSFSSVCVCIYIDIDMYVCVCLFVFVTTYLIIVYVKKDYL